ncbi:MAG: hypothetical protein IE921_00205 [Rhodobacteraceae bacterium]|nr:hypothetical protein [Paracoccaceae bacterium]
MADISNQIGLIAAAILTSLSLSRPERWTGWRKLARAISTLFLASIVLSRIFHPIPINIDVSRFYLITIDMFCLAISIILLFYSIRRAITLARELPDK